ncbi:MAG: pyridoxamine 5'-phosphate oxidase family protein [Cyanobacteria bacterium SID2]|nr:pyridoxamine 5'-phosphate oxidase family protein [Cyanobacteria bacterium SID2]
MSQEKLQGWTQDVSPFHPGEREIQTHLGIRDKTENIGRRFIRTFMPEQHRAFYAKLPFVMLGSLDDRGRPWASIVTGKPGFIASSDDVTLDITTRPLPGDPLNDTLRENADIGLLGIELETRRRNRVNGSIKAISKDGFTVAVTQSFGNCPQYIQKRQLYRLPERLNATSQDAQHSTQLTQPMRDLIANADTLFIATSYVDRDTSANQGVDVSHRGGKPGFVRVEDDRTFTFPNFSGNNFYNTLGNLLLNDRAGILFIDFDTGHLLSLTGRAEIVWDGEDVEAFQGAEQLVRVTIEKIVYRSEALPFRWAFQEYSPSLEFTGRWS